MIILTAFAIGLLSTSIRSLAGYILVGCLIVISFAFAALVSAGAVSFSALGLALLGYNAGIAATIVAAVATRVRQA